MHVIVPGHGVAAFGSHRYCTVSVPVAVQLPDPFTHWIVDLIVPVDVRCAQQICVPVQSSHSCGCWVPLQLPESDWLEQDSLVACPDPDERVIMRIERIGRSVLATDELT